MKRCLALVAGIGLLGVWSESAFAQAASSGESAPVFNPFASFSLSRFSFNTLGFLQVDSPSQAADASSSSSASDGGVEEEGAPQAVVVRPPFRPPVRSPYRPPPRPPF